MLGNLQLSDSLPPATRTSSERRILKSPFPEFALFVVGHLLDGVHETVARAGHVTEGLSAVVSLHVVESLAACAVGSLGELKREATRRLTQLLECSCGGGHSTGLPVLRPWEGPPALRQALRVLKARLNAFQASSDPASARGPYSQLLAELAVALVRLECVVRQSQPDLPSTESVMDDWVSTLCDQIAHLQVDLLPQSLLYDAWLTSVPTGVRPDGEMLVESAHPYDVKCTRAYALRCDGARSMSVYATEACEFAYGHCALVTRDVAGLVEVGTFGNASGVVHVPGGTAFVHFPVAAWAAYACGANVNGSLGLSSPGDYIVPTVVPALAGQRVVDAFADESCVILTQSGRVFTTGKALAGVDSPRDAPRLVAALAMHRVSGVTVGGGGVLAWCATGEAFSWGAIADGKLHKAPTLVDCLSGVIVTAAALGDEHALVVDDNGKVFSWGCGDALGHGSSSSMSSQVPRQVEALAGEVVFAVFASSCVSFALSLSLSVAERYGEVVRGRAGRAMPLPWSDVPADLRVRVWSWGNGDGSLTGHGDEETVEKPLEVDTLSDEVVIAMSLGNESALALTIAGAVWAWGDNASGELGLGDPSDCRTVAFPTEVDLGVTRAAMQVSVGASHSAVLACIVPAGSKKSSRPRERREKKRQPLRRARHVGGDGSGSSSDASGSKSSGDGSAHDGGSDEERSTSEASGDGAHAERDNGSLAPRIDAGAVGARIVLTFGARRNGRLGHVGQARGILSTPEAVKGLPKDIVVERVCASQHGTLVFTRPRDTIPAFERDVVPTGSVASGPWGMELKVCPNATNVPTLTGRHAESFASFSALCSGWTDAQDEQLIDLMNGVQEKGGVDWLKLPFDEIRFSQEQLAECHGLASILPERLRARIAVIQVGNRSAAAVLPWVNFSVSDWWSLAMRYQGASRHVLWAVKEGLWKKALKATRSSSSSSVKVDRMRATRQARRGVADVEGTESVFGQVFQQLGSVDPAELRENSSHVFQVKLRGEGAIDAGGPFREVMCLMCLELQSTTLPLLIPCPNRVNDTGYSREKWMLSPASVSLCALDMLEFLGRLMGIALRSGNTLSLDLPSLVWKGILSIPSDRQDLEVVDRVWCAHMDNVLRSAGEGDEVLPEEHFTTKLSDGTREWRTAYLVVVQFAGQVHLLS